MRHRKSKASKPVPSLKISEAEFQQLVIDLAHFCGYKVAHFRGVRVQRKDGTVYYQTPVEVDGVGWPDLILARPGRLIFAEIKSEKGQLSLEQEAWLKLLDTAGGESYIWKPSEYEDIQMVLLADNKPNRLEAVIKWVMRTR